MFVRDKYLIFNAQSNMTVNSGRAKERCVRDKSLIFNAQSTMTIISGREREMCEVKASARRLVSSQRSMLGHCWPEERHVPVSSDGEA